MRFQKRLPNDTATLLMVCVFIIVVVAVSLSSHDPASHHVKAHLDCRRGRAVARLPVVGRPLPARRPRSEHRTRRRRPRVALPAALALLAIAGVGSAFVSDWFIDALQPAIDKLGVSQAFAGLVIVAIAGNAVENFTGLVLAHKGQSDLAVSVVKNSVSQIAAFLFPVLVLISLFFKHTLTFAMAPVYAAALALTALSVWQITGDGEAAEFEGWALVGIYVVLAAVTLYEA